jgi:hypothetical protein
MANKKKQLEVEDLPGNSLSSRIAPIRETHVPIEEIPFMEQKPKRDRIPRAQIIRKKQSFTRSIARAFIGDGDNSVGGYILYDVLIPALKSLVTDAVTSGVEMLVYGETKGRSRSGGRDRGPKVINYGSFSRRDRDDDRRERRRPAYDDKFNLDEIYFDDHQDAEDVLDELAERLEEYDQVSVADFFDIAGIDGTTWAHDKFGWKSLKRARLSHTRHGYVILFPPPIELD